jgi:Nitroreductase family
MDDILGAIFQRRAVKVFERLEISQGLREQILNAARHAPSSFNSQPYRFYWVESETNRAIVARLCLKQKPAETASALVVAVADIGSMPATNARPVGVDAGEQLLRRENPRLRADSKHRPDPVHTWAIRHFRRRKMAGILAAEFVEDERYAASVPSGLAQMGYEEHIVGLPESNDRCRGAGSEHLSHGRL